MTMGRKQEAGCGAWCVALLIGFALMPVSMLWRGYVLMILWRWFVVPVFALPVLSPWQAIGLSVMVTAMAPVASRGKRDEDERGPWQTVAESVGAALIAPAITLGIGWVVTWFL